MPGIMSGHTLMRSSGSFRYRLILKTFRIEGPLGVPPLGTIRSPIVVIFVGILALKASPAQECPLPARSLTERLQAVAGAGMVSSHSFQYMEELSDKIGGRVTGSTEAAAAIDWGLGKMRSIGLQNVHAEPWQLWRGWSRGPAEASLIFPTYRKLEVDSMGWVGSTAPGGVDADVLQIDIDNPLDKLLTDSPTWAGKVLLIHRGAERSPQNASNEYGKFLVSAHEAHAIAVIGGQGGAKSAGVKLTHTGILGFTSYFDIPVVSMAAEDQEQIERLLRMGSRVRLHINVQNSISSGPVPSANVIGEIIGTEDPEQIFVVGGHLDSWDLGQGATDNGCGSATVLGAAEAILRSGMKPRRTIRFVLFTGEEQGLVGSREYVKRHQSEMPNHIGDIVLDEGQGAIGGFDLNGRTDLIDSFSHLVQSISGFGQFSIIADPVFGTDTGPFTLAGLPGILVTQDTTDYQISHHSAADTVDKVDAAVLIRNTTIEALVAFWIADQPERFAAPWPPDKTEQMLKDTHVEDRLKSLGMWPF